MISRYSTLFLVFLLLSGCVHTRHQDETGGARKPKTEMTQAIEMARSYINSHNIDVSNQFLSRVSSFHDVYNPVKTGWVLTWVPRDPLTLDGEWSIYVYDNGLVRVDGE